MAVGTSHLAFAEAAAADGIELSNREWFDWLIELGHVALEDMAAQPPEGANVDELERAAETLETIYAGCGGDLDVLYACRATLFLPIDLVHVPTGTLIELDEAHHFTSYRLAALDAYPPDARLGFDIDAYRQLCREGAEQYDGFQRGVAAKGFGIGGTQRERAYRDSLRDLGAPAMGHPPVVRITAMDDDGAAAYARHRDLITSLVGVPG